MFFGQFIKCIVVFFASLLFYSWFFSSFFVLPGYFIIVCILLALATCMILGALYIYKNKHDYNLAGKLFLQQNLQNDNNEKKDN